MAEGLLRKLNQNLPVSLQSGAGEDEPRHPATLYGSIGDEYLVFGGLPLPEFAAGDEIIARMVIEGQALAFRSTVECVVESPKRLLFVSYPAEAATADLRSTERINVFVPADLLAETTQGSEQQTLMLKTVVVNLSGGGCCVSVRKPLEPQSEINVSFALPGETYVHSLVGTVLGRVRKDSSYVLRVKFPKITPNVLALGDISKWVTQYAGYGLP